MSEPKTPDETCEPIEIGHVVDDYDNMAVIYINDGHVEIPIYDDDTEPGKDGKIPPALVLTLSPENARSLANLLDHALMHIDNPDIEHL
jgi:hypothetical protein